MGLKEKLKPMSQDGAIKLFNKLLEKSQRAKPEEGKTASKLIEQLSSLIPKIEKEYEYQQKMSQELKSSTEVVQNLLGMLKTEDEQISLGVNLNVRMNSIEKRMSSIESRFNEIESGAEDYDSDNPKDTFEELLRSFEEELNKFSIRLTQLEKSLTL